jgi:two-component system NarL family response regulator
MRQGIVSIVSGQADMQVVGEMACATAALETYAGTPPHIVIVDICTAQAPAMALLKKVRSGAARARIILLTSTQDERCLRRFIQAGAFAVLSTDVSTASLMDAIRCVLAGERRVDPALMQRLYFDLAPKLSEREVEVLACVAQGHSNSKIGALLGIAVETVKTHLKNLLSKLGASNRTEAVMIAVKRGLLEL